MKVDHVVTMIAAEVFPKKAMLDPVWGERWPALSGLFVKYGDIVTIRSRTEGTNVTIDADFDELEILEHVMIRRFDLQDPEAVDEMEAFFRRCLRKARFLRLRRAISAPLRALWATIKFLVLNWHH